jgi:hypothetical protein
MRLGTQCLICAKSWTPWLQKSNCTYRLPLGAGLVATTAFNACTTRPAVVEQLEHDMVDAEPKARARGIQKVVTSFMFVCTLYYLSEVMPQLTIFCKTLQAVDIGVDGVVAAYRTTRGILMGYKKDISKLPFTRHFISALS